MNASPVDLDDTLDFPPADGPYRQAYKTTLAVGKGAFGFVKLALHRQDRREVTIALEFPIDKEWITPKRTND